MILYSNNFRQMGYLRNIFRTALGSAIALKGTFFLITLLLTFGDVHGATINLCNLLSSTPSGGTVTLDPQDTYRLTAECPLYKSVTIVGNGVTIQGVGPLHTHGTGVTLTVDNLVFQSAGWGALAAGDGSQIVVKNNSSISCPGGTGVFAATGSTVTIQNSSITSSNFGVNMFEPSTGILHGVTITGCPYAVQVVGPSSSVTIDGGSLFEYNGDGAGVGILNGASGVVHDSTIRGFLNAIDVQPSGGTVEVVNCRFENNRCSALSAIYAQNVLFSDCLVQDALQDGIFFYHSTGVIEKSQIIGSRNSGVTFQGCSNGATIRNCLIKDSVDQGLGIVEDGKTPSAPSLNIQVLNNCFINNQIANLLIDATSTAKLQGNIFAQTPDANIRLHGPQDITLDSALFIDSSSGFEIKGGSTPMLALSNVSENDKNGILVYDNSFLTVEHSFFWNNGLLANGGSSDSYSIFVNTGAKVNAHHCTLGPAGKWAFYNNSTASCDVISNYWDASDGPNVASWIRIPPNGSGAHLDSSYTPLAPVIYNPFLTQPPVDSHVDLNVSLPSEGNLTWNSQLGVTLGLTPKTNSPILAGEIVSVLRVNDTESLNLVTPPDGLLPGQLYVVWISTLLRLNSDSGFLEFSLPSQEGPVELKRREINGSWISVSSGWDQNSHLLTCSPSDVHLLNGTFALTSPPSIAYVHKSGYCSGKTPCFSSIQNAINSADASTIIEISEETYNENLTINAPKIITLLGGWNSNFTAIVSTTKIAGGFAINSGKITVENILLD